MTRTSIRARVSPQAIDKVTHIFNGTLGDILSELCQNARRAGATKLVIDSYSSEGQRVIRITDDGIGIADPQALLSLGQSEWSDGTKKSEDPAGMGFFALAGRRAWVASKTPAAGFALEIPAMAWTGTADVAVEPYDGPQGTKIAFDSPIGDERAIVSSVAAAAIHFPLPVLFNGEVQRATDFLDGAHRIIRANGVRIGVYQHHRGDNAPNVNFHGVTLRHNLPHVTEWRSTKWSVRVDIEDAPDLVLVLPARKEFHYNDALERLIDDCRAAIYTSIADEPFHQLGHTDWLIGTDYVPALPEARAWLSPWEPSPAREHWRNHGAPEAIPASAVLYDEEDSYDAFSFARALKLGDGPVVTPFIPVALYVGYPWYDAIPKYRREKVVYTGPGGDQLEPVTPSFRPAAIAVTIGANKANPITYRTDLVIGDSEFSTDDPDEIFLALTTSSTITPAELCDLIVDAGFSPNDSSDADSFDTQEDRYRHDAFVRATEILHGDEAATIAGIELAFRDRIAWRVPRDKQVTIQHTLGRTMVLMAEAPQEALA